MPDELETEKRRAAASPALRDQREIADFVLEAIADRGVHAVHLKDILGFRPRSRFYACFEGKDECVRAALEAATVDLLAVTEANGIGGLLGRVKAKPTLARVVFVEGRSIDLGAIDAFIADLADRLDLPVGTRTGDELRACGLFHLIGIAARRGSLARLADDLDIRTFLSGS